MIKKEKKYLFILFLTCTLILMCYFGLYIINNVPQLYGTDIRPQWFLFYEEFRNLITNLFENKALPFYSWSTFLGNNFYASKSYYLMGDLFSYIGLLFNTGFFQTALILEIIKFYIAAYSMYYLLTQFGIKPIVKIIGAICFTFSGWAIFFSGQLVFHSFYALAPLYFAGLEKILQKRMPYLFIVLTTLCLFVNFYFFFTLSFCTVIYYIYRYYIINDSFKTFAKDTAITIGYYFIGVLITMILTLPTIFYILGSDRLGSFSEGLFFGQVQVYLHDLASMFVPNYLYIYNNNVFETKFHYSREICMYASALTAVSLPLIITCKSKLKKATLGVWIVFAFIMIFPRLGSVIHGFSDPSFRWTFFLILFNIITSCHILNDLENLKVSILKKSSLFIVLLILFIVPITAIIINQPVQDFTKQWTLFSIFAFVILLYSLTLYKKPRNMFKILLAFVTIELAASGLYLYNSRMDFSKKENYEFIDKVSHVLQDYDNQLNNTLDAIEPVNPTQYYRVYIPHESLYWSYSHNMSIIYQLNGLMTYDSTYSPSVNDLKVLEPSVKDFKSEWIFNIKDMNLLNFLNTKYAVVTNESELPKGGNWRLLSDNYRMSLSIYRNDSYRDLGTTYSKIDDINNYTDSSSLIDTIYAQSSDIEKIKPYLISNESSNLENISYYNNQLSGYVYSSESSFMIITLPYDKGWKVQVNGLTVPTYKVNGGFIGIPINAGDNNIEMYFTPQGFKQGAILSVVGVVCLFILILFESKKKK